MRRLGLLVSVLATALLMSTPGVTSASSAYVTYVACSTSKQAPPATSCSKNSDKAAFFESKNASVTYNVCVKFPNGTKLCAQHQSAPKGVKKVNRISSTMKGTHKVTWFVNGTKVGAWTFQVT